MLSTKFGGNWPSYQGRRKSEMFTDRHTDIQWTGCGQKRQLEFKRAPIQVKLVFISAVSYQWYKDDKQFVRPDLHTYIFISRNGKLYFSEVSTPDRGNYRCIVKLTAHNGAAIGTDQPPSRTSLPTLLDVQNGSKVA